MESKTLISTDCIFCKIARHEIPACIIHEDTQFVTFMDIYPPTVNGKITMPVVIVITKEHFGSNAFEDLADGEYISLLEYTRKIAKAIQRALNPMRVCLVFEGMEIDHVHSKLYPIFKDGYPGYLSTEKGSNNEATRASDQELQRIADLIKQKVLI